MYYVITLAPALVLASQDILIRRVFYVDVREGQHLDFELARQGVLLYSQLCVYEVEGRPYFAEHVHWFLYHAVFEYRYRYTS